MEITITKDEDTGRIIEAFVKSESKEGIFYKVEGKIFGDQNEWKCSCPANSYSKEAKECKHILAVREETGQ